MIKKYSHVYTWLITILFLLAIARFFPLFHNAVVSGIIAAVFILILIIHLMNDSSRKNIVASIIQLALIIIILFL